MSRLAKHVATTAAFAAVGVAAQRTAGYQAAVRVIWIGCVGTAVCFLLGAMYSAPIMYVLAVVCIIAAIWAWVVGYNEQQQLLAEQDAEYQRMLGEQSQREYAERMIAEQHPSWVSAPAPTHRRVTRTVAVSNRPAEAAQRPQETHNDVEAPTAPPTRPTLILPRYSGRAGKPRHGEDHGFFTIDDYRGFDPELGE